jgi:serine/threonine protein kinase/Tfp pilus assembly protein PilF
MPLASGTRLGPYAVTSLIGAGGMGEVYKAADTRLSRTVAIKVLAEHVASDPEQRQRFEREAKAISSLNHPHICALYDIGMHDGIQFLVMEHVDGEALAQRLMRGALPVQDALRLAIEMADALGAAHARGIVHRDFKPANVMLTTRGAKLLDFGIAKVVADLGTGAHARQALTLLPAGTFHGHAIGTVSYMSPEQARGLLVDRRTDVWAFGCVLFEMLTGNKAFDGGTAADTTLAILEREPNLAAIPSAAPAVVRRVLQRCFEKSAERRFDNMGEIATELRDALAAVRAASTQEDRPSVAVLPFVNMSADPENEYFSDGLTEEILNALTEIPGLRVIARTSAFAFKGKNEDVRRIAETLGVTSIVEGSVRKAGTRIRVTAQLIHASDGSHLWSKRYDREFADVFAVQDEIAVAIAEALRVTIVPQSVETRRRASSVEAYELFLEAQFHFRKSTFEGFKRSSALCEQAIAVDPEFALGHFGLGRNLFILYTGSIVPPHDAVPRIRKHVEDALNLDPSLPEGHALLGSMAALYDYNWAEADRRFRLATASGSMSFDVRFQRTNYFLAHAGRGAEAVEDLNRARADDPLNSALTWVLGVALRSAHRDVEADKMYLKTLDIDDGYVSTIAAVVLSGNCLERGEVREALTFAEKAHTRYSQLPWAIGQYAGVLARVGETDRSRALVAQLHPGTAFGAPFGLALAAIGANDLDEAADWLEKAIEQRDLWVSFLLNVGNIGGRVMWSNPKWPRLAALMNVPPSRLAEVRLDAGRP